LAQNPGKGSDVPSEPETIQERLKRYRLDRFVKALPTLPPTRDDIHFDPGRKELMQFYARVPVESLDDLKLWTGFPNDHIDHAKYKGHLKPFTVPALASMVGARVLDVVSDQTLADAEHNLLFGYVDQELLRDVFWMAVAHRLLERIPSLPILVIKDLIVYNDQRVTFSNTPTAFFNTVTLYGSGRLQFRDACKVITDKIESVPFPRLLADDVLVVPPHTIIPE
jgi:hypothetical protein